jgi:hypothetical protein
VFAVALGSALLVVGLGMRRLTRERER